MISSTLKSYGEAGTPADDRMAKQVKNKNRAGFSLIETIVAFAIIAIILVVALAGFNTIARVGNSAQEWNMADQTVEDMIANDRDGVETATLDITLTPTGSDSSAPVVIPGVLRTFTDLVSGRTITIFVPD